MPKEDNMKVTGKVDEVLPSLTFKVKLNEFERTIICHMSGRMRKHRIKVLKGDTVQIEMSLYDLDKGRITRRL
jgi:translation initiation factor IF-1